MSSTTEPHLKKIAKTLTDMVFYIVVLALVMIAFGTFVSSNLDGIQSELERSNKIECIKLRESGADSSGSIDREACPWDLDE